MTRIASPFPRQSIRSEIVLWAIVPSGLLAAWMYVFPTAAYTPDTTPGVRLWGVFNSWKSLLVPLVALSIPLAIRLWTVATLRRWLLPPIVCATAVAWIVFAAAIKSTAFRLIYLSDVIGVRWSPP